MKPPAWVDRLCVPAPATSPAILLLPPYAAAQTRQGWDAVIGAARGALRTDA